MKEELKEERGGERKGGEKERGEGKRVEEGSGYMLYILSTLQYMYGVA